MTFSDIFKGRDLRDWIFKNSSMVFFVKIFGALLTFFLQVLAARLLGAEQFGIYVYVLSGVMLLSLFAAFGFEQLQTRYISAYRVEGKMRELLLNNAKMAEKLKEIEERIDTQEMNTIIIMDKLRSLSSPKQ